MNGLGFTPTDPYTGSIVIAFNADSPREEAVSITTDNYTLRPTTNASAVVTFYDSYIFGNKKTMMESFMTPSTNLDETRNKVDSFVQKWKSGDYFSSFVVYENDTTTPVAHAVLGHGIANGESDYSLLIRNDTPPEIRMEDEGMPSYVKDEGMPSWNKVAERTSSFDHINLRTKSDHAGIINRLQIASEVTYALFQGWAPWLAENGIEVTNEVEHTKHPLHSIIASYSEKTEAYKVLSRMLESNSTNSMESCSTSIGGNKSVHFFTTIKEMTNMRKKLLGEGSSSGSSFVSPPLVPNGLHVMPEAMNALDLDNGILGDPIGDGSDRDVFDMDI